MALSLRIARVALMTVLLLLIPFIAMLVTSEMQWDGFDFIVAGGFIMGTGVAYEVLTTRTKEVRKKLLVAGALFIVFLLIWAELAVGLFH